MGLILRKYSVDRVQNLPDYIIHLTLQTDKIFTPKLFTYNVKKGLQYFNFYAKKINGIILKKYSGYWVKNLPD